MIRQCFLAKTGIRFHSDLLPALGIQPSALWPEVLKRPPALVNADISSIPSDSLTAVPAPDPSHSRMSTAGTLVNYADVPPPGSGSGALTEEQEDLLDIRCEVYDQLKLALYWWVLEIIPLRHKVQQEDSYWSSDF